LKKLYTIDELNEKIKQDRHRNLVAIPYFLERLKRERFDREINMTDKQKRTRIWLGKNNYECGRCGIVYKGNHLCPCCDNRPYVKVKGQSIPSSPDGCYIVPKREVEGNAP
jgi:rubrerythrin